MTNGVAVRTVLLLLAVSGAVAGSSSGHSQKSITIAPLGTYVSGAPLDSLGAEVAAYDPGTRRLFIVNVHARTVDIVDITDPSAPAPVGQIAVTPYGSHANSVAVRHGIVVAAVQAEVKTDPGKAVFFDTSGTFLAQVTVGPQPDMITFTPDGRRILVANEGEPNDAYDLDPEGSVSIIELRRRVSGLTDADVVTAGFAAFNDARLDRSIRIFGPGATVAQDLEPEHITVSDDSETAWVVLQENNAIAELDLERRRFTRLTGLGFKDHSRAWKGLDAGDRDGPANAGRINIARWPVLGMYLPDAIVSYKVKGRTYLVTANEGDARDYDGFAEEARVSSLALDPAVFPDAAVLQTNAQLGRLTVTTAGADRNGDGLVDRLLAFGARSFSIWTDDGRQVFDSGDALEKITAAALPAFFNSDHVSNTSFDTRSDNKGPEPEGVAVAKISGRWYAFVGLERIGGIVVTDITDPFHPHFVQYVNNRNFTGSPAAGTAGDLGPEGLFVISEDDSPTGRPLLVVTNEVSGTTTVFGISKAR